MPVKLTLSVERAVIERAKRFSQRQHKSLSKLVEGYLREVTGGPSGREEIGPKVASLSGVIPRAAVRGDRSAGPSKSSSCSVSL